MLEIYAVEQDEIIDDDRFKFLLPYVSEEKQTRIKRYMRKSCAQQALMGDLLVRSIIHEKLYMRNQDIRFGYNKYGKPFLIGNDDFHFNLSHSGDWIVCAVSDSIEGIDVEKIKPTDYDISKRFFSPDEYNYLLCKKEKEKLCTFYDLWTLKESYTKAIGKGLYMPLNTFSIIIYNELISINPQFESNFFNFKQFALDLEYKLSVCLGDEFREEEMSVMSMTDFLSDIEKKIFYGF